MALPAVAPAARIQAAAARPMVFLLHPCLISPPHLFLCRRVVTQLVPFPGAGAALSGLPCAFRFRVIKVVYYAGAAVQSMVICIGKGNLYRRTGCSVRQDFHGL